MLMADVLPLFPLHVFARAPYFEPVLVLMLSMLSSTCTNHAQEESSLTFYQTRGTLTCGPSLGRA